MSAPSPTAVLVHGALTDASVWHGELDWSETSMGVISLRRRIEPSLKVDVYEVKLGDEFLMSSLFTVAEVELLDIDHTPRHVLHRSHSPFYTAAGLGKFTAGTCIQAGYSRCGPTIRPTPTSRRPLPRFSTGSRHLSCSFPIR